MDLRSAPYLHSMITALECSLAALIILYDIYDVKWPDEVWLVLRRFGVH